MTLVSLDIRYRQLWPGRGRISRTSREQAHEGPHDHTIASPRGRPSARGASEAFLTALYYPLTARPAPLAPCASVSRVVESSSRPSVAGRPARALVDEFWGYQLSRFTGLNGGVILATADRNVGVAAPERNGSERIGTDRIGSEAKPWWRPDDRTTFWADLDYCKVCLLYINAPTRQDKAKKRGVGALRETPRKSAKRNSRAEQPEKCSSGAHPREPHHHAQNTASTAAMGERLARQRR